MKTTILEVNMLKFLPTLFLFFVLVMPLSAQDTTDYRLRQTSLEDYVTAIAPAMAYAADQERPYEAGNLITLELNRYYDLSALGTLHYDLLRSTYDEAYDWLLFTTFDLTDWLAYTVEAAYREGRFTLAEGEVALPDGLVLAITSQDIQGDGQPEYLIRATLRREVYVMAHTGGTGDISFAHLPIDAIVFDYPDRQTYDLFTFDDLNGDGTQEILARYISTGSGEGNGRLYVLQWQEGQWGNLATHPLFTYSLASMESEFQSPDWTITGDRVEMRYTESDGYACTTEIMHILDASDGSFVTQTDETAEISVGCAVRDAQDAYRLGDFLEAILHYETALSRAGEYDQLAAYITSRLALSYAHVGQVDRARSVLQNHGYGGVMGDLLDQLAEVAETQSPLISLCNTTYDFFDTIDQNPTQPDDVAFAAGYANGYGGGYPEGWAFGSTNTQFGVSLPVPLFQCDVYTVDPTQQPLPFDLIYDDETIYNEARQAYGSQRYAEVLDLTNEGLAAFNVDNAIWEYNLYRMRYLRARALEALNRPDEALEDYIALVENAPQTPWGVLASLHIE